MSEKKHNEVALQDRYWVGRVGGGYFSQHDSYEEAELEAREESLSEGEQLVLKAVASVKPDVSVTKVEKFV